MRGPEDDALDAQLGFGFLEPADDTSTSEIAPEASVDPPPFGPTGFAASATEGAASTSALLESLRRATQAQPLRRKILVAETRGEGRELLRALARAGCPWVGWEVLTPRPLALELASSVLRHQGQDLLDEFDEQALLDSAIDEALEGRGVSEADRSRGFEALSEAVGFRGALAGAVQALRAGGVTPDAFARVRLEDTAKKGLIGRALGAYERALAARGAVDGAGLFDAATAEVLQHGFDRLDASLYLIPGFGTRGRRGDFMRALTDAGGSLLETDAVRGLEVPEGWFWRAAPGRPSPLSSLHDLREADEPVTSLEMFSAAGVEDELREVLRRIVERGLTWDQVEILTPDPQVYGSALHALASRLGVPVTFGVGLGVGRTRPGRAVSAYFRWIEGGFQASEIRRLLESGDLRSAKEDGPDPMALSRRFRELRIGWGRERTRQRILDRIASVERIRPRFREPSAGFVARKEQARSELEALRGVLFPILDATPRIPAHPLAREQGTVSPAALAHGLRRFLSFVPVDNAVDTTAFDRLEHVLARIVATLVRPTSYASAAAAVQAHIHIRVPAPRAEGKAPWSSDSGHLYLTDLEHGGFTGRRATYVVGLDAQRFPGTHSQDPLLLDRERRRLGKGRLPTSGDRIQEHRFRFAATLARLRGEVTLSWCAWDPAEARARAPAGEILQACRLRLGRQQASFDDLRSMIGNPTGVVPRVGVLPLDTRDVWMRALASGGSLREGAAVVRESFPWLARGDRAIAALGHAKATSYLGQVEARPELDLRTADGVLSASRLEDLGTCPRRYLYGTVLRMRALDDPDFDPDRWLDAKARGTLLHDTYERFLREMRVHAWDPRDPEVIEHARAILRREADRALDELPAPSEEVRLKELDRLLDDVQSFVGMIAEHGAPWLDLEVKFGFGDSEPVRLPVEGGRLLMRGRVDRVDDTDGGLRIVDYKTGGAFAFQADKGVFNGGRRLQHYVYWMAVRSLYDRAVLSMEYHFPTHRSVNERIVFEEQELRAAPKIVGKLFDAVRGGHFLPTDEKGDCRFCDFKAVCRVQTSASGEVKRSPPAEWADRHAGDLTEYRAFRSARRHEDEGHVFPLEPLDHWWGKMRRD